ncbi:MAG: DUF167 family protein [Ancalomicrobiaceae bacterium]|nr:DUF167 family protein [Ancalomicrobiaceae bacterium]
METSATTNRIRVRLTPRSARDELDGVEVLSDGTSVFAARVRAVPEKGAANAALETLVAKTLGVARTRVSVVSGSTSRIKTVAIEGDAETVARRLADLAGPPEKP